MAIKCGIKDGHAYVARLDWKQEYFEDAVLEVQKGVRMNNIMSISTLGGFYEEGIPDMADMIIIHKPDYAKAWDCYQKAFNMGGRIEDAISMSRLYVKKEYVPEDLNWETIESYLEKGAQIPIIEAIELMVEALRQNGKEVDALKYIKIGADTGSLPMMYEYGARTLSESPGEALKYLEESGQKGYIPAIERLLTHFGDRHSHSDIEYGKCLEMAIQYGVPIPIDDYCTHLYNNYRFKDLLAFLKEQYSEEPSPLFLMAKYFPVLPFKEDEIRWILNKLAVHYRTLVTIDTHIYEYYSDLLIHYGSEEEYIRFANEVGEIDDNNNREEYLLMRRSIRLQSLKDYQTKIKENLKTEEMRREWVQRFKHLELIAETLKKKVLIIDAASSMTSLIKACLEYEQFEVVVLKLEDAIADETKIIPADLIILNFNPTSENGKKLIQRLQEKNPYNLLVIDSYQQKEHIEGIETVNVPVDLDYIVLSVRRTISLSEKLLSKQWAEKTNKKKILILDDKETIAKVMCIYIMSDYDVQWLPDGLHAVQWLKNGNIPDLIVADIRMPMMRGDDFLEWIKQNSYLKRIPVIMLSSEDSTSERIRLLEAGAEDYIVKPFDPKEMKIRIRKILPV